MERISWIKNGSVFRKVEGSVANVESIPVGIYNVNFNPMSGWSLEQTGEKFTFNYKVYGLQSNFIDYVLKTFENTKGNLGILLNGVKGTGKSVVAKILANKFNLPIIIVKSFGDNNDALIEYLSSFNFDCVFFMDEFEKNWDEKDSSILSIMDGVYTSNYRRIFLLTTNETRINDNLLSRPSRLRYIKEFGNIEQDIVREYLNDNLKNPECIDCIIDFIDTLQISTIDILKSIVEDINIHGFEKFIENKNIFNIKTATYYYYTYTVEFDNIEEVKDHNYNIDTFIKDIKINETVRQPNRYSFRGDEDAYQNALQEWNKKRCNVIINNREVNSEKPFKSLKPGDKFGYLYSEKIIKIDHEKKVIITSGDGVEINFYFIKNADAKPSLYSASQMYINPYFEM